jgi:hypothetical protein
MYDQNYGGYCAYKEMEIVTIIPSLCIELVCGSQMSALRSELKKKNAFHWGQVTPPLVIGCSEKQEMLPSPRQVPCNPVLLSLTESS